MKENDRIKCGFCKNELERHQLVEKPGLECPICGYYAFSLA